MTTASLQKGIQVRDTIESITVMLENLKESKHCDIRLTIGEADKDYLKNMSDEVVVAIKKILKKHLALKEKEFSAIK